MSLFPQKGTHINFVQFQWSSSWLSDSIHHWPKLISGGGQWWRLCFDKVPDLIFQYFTKYFEPYPDVWDDVFKHEHKQFFFFKISRHGLILIHPALTWRMWWQTGPRWSSPLSVSSLSSLLLVSKNIGEDIFWKSCPWMTYEQNNYLFTIEPFHDSTSPHPAPVCSKSTFSLDFFHPNTTHRPWHASVTLTLFQVLMWGSRFIIDTQQR